MAERGTSLYVPADRVSLSGKVGEESRGEGSEEGAVAIAVGTQKIADLVDMVTAYMHIEVDVDVVREFVAEAYRIADTDYGVKEAAQWGDGFTIPTEAVDEDEELLDRHGGNFEALVKERQGELLSGRLNHDRINRLHEENPEIERLRDLVGGMQIPLPPGFKPNGQRVWPKMRSRYLQTASAVDKMVFELRKQKLAVIIRKARAKQIKNIHLSPAHWTKKKNKLQGRNLIDSSDGKEGALNSEEVKEMAVELWEPIKHPTIVTFMKKFIVRYDLKVAANPRLSWDDFSIFKMDLRGAFNLLFFRPDGAQYFATELVGGLVIIFLCGIFGWAGTPFAFNVVTRAIRYELQVTQQGEADMYVDDLAELCETVELQSEIVSARRVCTDLMGEEAVEDTKTETTEDEGRRRSIDLIGWNINLAFQVVTMARKNLLKSFYGFFELDVDRPVPVRTMERLASFGSRYVIICRWLGPWNHELYASYTGVARHKSIKLPAGAKLAIRLWRAGLCALELNVERFGRSFDSFRPFVPTHVLQFDASLWGVGPIVLSRQAGKVYSGTSDDERLLGGSAASLAALDFQNESIEFPTRYQNTAEFIAIVMGLITIRRLGITDIRILLRGDNRSALKWAADERYAGSTVTNAAVIFTLMVWMWDVQIAEKEYINTKDNVVPDYLSRNPEATLESLGFPDAVHVSLSDPVAQGLLALCDPRLDISTEQSFREFWKQAHGLITAV